MQPIVMLRSGYLDSVVELLQALDWRFSPRHGVHGHIIALSEMVHMLRTTHIVAEIISSMGVDSQCWLYVLARDGVFDADKSLRNLQHFLGNSDRWPPFSELPANS